MTTYRTRVSLPEDFTEYLTDWFGQGKVVRIDAENMIFEFDADDLWDAAHIVKGINPEASMDKPTEVMPEAYVPVREGEWLGLNATPIYRILKIAMDYADASSDHALAQVIRTKRTEILDLFPFVKDNPDVMKGA